MNDDDTAELVENLRRGVDRERSARILYERHSRSVASSFVRRGLSGSDASDLTQEVFLRVFRGIGDFRGDAKFPTWLLKVAQSVYCNELRRRHADMREGIEESLDASPADGGDGKVAVIASPDPDPLGELLDKERRGLDVDRLKKIRAAMERMPPQMQRCFELRYLQRYKYREIAVLMRLADGTVKALLNQARQRLKTELGEVLPED